jgi:hypothetical protein
MEDQQDAPPANNRAVKLPPFWTANPRAWFASAEGAFQLRNIADERRRFFNCLHALPEATVCLIADLVEADPLPENPHTELRRRRRRQCGSMRIRIRIRSRHTQSRICTILLNFQEVL